MKKFLIIGFLLATANVRLQEADQQPPTIQPTIPIPPTPLQESFAAILSLLQQQTAALMAMQQQIGQQQQQQTANLMTLQQATVAEKIFPCPFPGCGKLYTRNEYRNRHMSAQHPGYQPAIPTPVAAQATAIPAPLPIVPATVVQEQIGPVAVQAPVIPGPVAIAQAPAVTEEPAAPAKGIIEHYFRKNPDGTYQCLFCKKPAYKPDTLPSVLYRHVRNKHKTPDKTYDCEICGNKYEYSFSLSRHKRKKHSEVNDQVAAQANDQVAAQDDDQGDDQVDQTE